MIFKPEEVNIVSVGPMGLTSFHIPYLSEGFNQLTYEEIDNVITQTLLHNYPNYKFTYYIYKVEYCNNPDVDINGTYHNICTIQVYLKRK